MITTLALIETTSFWLRAEQSGARNPKDTVLRQAQHKFQAG